MDHCSPILGTTVGNSTTTLNSLNGNTFADQALPFWVETKTSDNKVYYYNSTTKETTWKRPENVRIVKYEEMVKQSTGSSTSGTYIQSSARTTTSSDNLYHQSPVANLDLTLQKPSLASPSYNVLRTPRQVNINSHPLQVQPQLRLAQPLLQQHEPILDSKQAYPQQQQQLHLQSGPQPQHQPSVSNSQGSLTKSKHVSTTPIPGTPWSIVWTDKNKVFYFNPSTKTSVWERPAELRNREDVDRMVSNNPDSSLTPAQSITESRPSPIGDQSPMQAEKKIKLDSGQTSSTINSSVMGTRPVIAPKIVKKEVISEVEKETARKRKTIPLDERIDTFRKMLEEREVHPASTFHKELSENVSDPRYLLLTSNERRKVFEKYCREKTEEERHKKMEKIKKATDEFKSLLNEANLTSKALYDEFHSRYSKDPRYQALEHTKDRKTLFDDHLAMLRRKERDERPPVTSRPPRRASPRGVIREKAEDIFHTLQGQQDEESAEYLRRKHAFIRSTITTDYQPDICKDYKQTGFCGFGDSCKFLHDRSDYKHGWQLEQEWAKGEYKDEEDDKYLIKDEDVNDDPGIPLSCAICKNAYKNPIVTKCKHYFCIDCAEKECSSKCFTCEQETSGIFKNASKQMKAEQERLLKESENSSSTSESFHEQEAREESSLSESD